MTLAESTLGNRQDKFSKSSQRNKKTRQPFRLAGFKLWEGTITPLGCTHKLTRRVVPIGSFLKLSTKYLKHTTKKQNPVSTGKLTRFRFFKGATSAITSALAVL